MGTSAKAQNAYFALRVASAMCFIGHGCFGIIGKAIWCNYFAVFGIGHAAAIKLMPVVGTIDILLGIVIILYPIRIVFMWLVCWGMLTAALRPLSGEPFAEFIERAGNYGAPLSLLLLYEHGWHPQYWFGKLNMPLLTPQKELNKVTLCLKIAAALLLTGHGLLNIAGKASLLSQYNHLGFAHPHQVAILAGLLELLMAASVLIKPLRLLLLITLIWKMTTELFYPHYEIFEWIERGGSYGVLLALLFTTAKHKVNFNIHTRIANADPGFTNHNFKSNEKEHTYYNRLITYNVKNIFTGLRSHT